MIIIFLAHVASQHSQTMSRAQAKQTRTVDIEFAVNRRGGGAHGRGGSQNP